MIRGSRATRIGPPTGTSCVRCWCERLQTRNKLDWFTEIIAAGVPCGPINTIDGGVAFAEEVGLDPVIELGPDGAEVRSVRNPITLSETPPSYRLPPPGLGEHDAEIRAWLPAPRKLHDPLRARSNPRAVTPHPLRWPRRVGRDWR